MSAPTDPRYNEQTDYIQKLHNISKGNADYNCTVSGRRDFPIHYATVILNGAIYEGASGSGVAKNVAKKRAAFQALAMLGYI